MYSVLIKPLVTEKMTLVSESGAKFGFIVDINANKVQIAKEIENRYDVNVVSVNTIRNKGKKRTQATRKGRFTGRTPRYKKAIVTIKSDQTIDIFGEV